MESSRSPTLVLLLCGLVGQYLAGSIACPSGQEEKNGHCVVTNVCLSCPFGSRCRNLNSMVCHCNPGFRLCLKSQNCTSGRPYCRDVDECRANPSRCGSGATCVNTIGSYCCIFSTASRNVGSPKCSKCEYDCYFNNKMASKSTVTAQMCMSACQMEALYRNMSMMRRVSGQENKASQFLDNAESVLMSLIEVPLKQKEERKLTSESEIVLRRQVSPKDSLRVSALGNTMEVDPVVFSGMAAARRVPTLALIVHKNMTNILGKNTQMEEIAIKSKTKLPRMVLNSAVLTAVINSKNKSFHTHAITFTFLHTKVTKDVSNKFCAYWNRTAKGKFWSPKGCELVSSNQTHTVCRSRHLSSFAVLMALKDLPNVFEVNIITYIGLSISLVCLLLAIATFVTCQSVKDLRRTIHINLCLSLFIADLVFLVGISRTENEVLCAIIAAILHYSFLAVFSWMFLEGIQLYLMVQVVFVPTVPFERFIYWIGYGFPAVVVAISAAVDYDGYGNEKQCWLDTKNYFVLSFYVPALVISIINLIFLLNTLMILKVELAKMFDKKKHAKRIFTLTAIGQSIILGCTWIFGAFYLQQATIPMMYMFTIMNSFQGMFIFIMHCLMYKKVRDAYFQCFRKCLRKSYIWTPVSNSSLRSSSNQPGRSVQETESTTSGIIR